jgi:ATP-dependent Lon protease
MRVVVQGLARVQLTETLRVEPFVEPMYTVVQDSWPESTQAVATDKLLRSSVRDAAKAFGAGVPVESVLQRVTDTSSLVDAIAAFVDASHEWKREILLTLDPVDRADRVLEKLTEVKEVLDAQQSIRDRVKTNGREAMLRQQLAAIQQELGESDTQDDLALLKEKLAGLDLPNKARESVDRELKRLDRMPAQSPERNVAVDWLDRLSSLPWGITSAANPDLDALEEALDKSHHGLEDVKRQVVEHLAVRMLAGSGRADVLLLLGPPGVGKTSIGEAIAEATGRELVRMALGGVRDEAELRGHRRTYIGARPGRVIEGLRQAGTSDPILLLDEIDKLGRGWMGDPAAALLEILDPEQNHSFIDRYLEVPFDLSKVLFIATANDLSQVPVALRDRMEIIEIAGYTPAEKATIARNHLLEKLAVNAGLATDDVNITDEAIRDAIAGWTQEAGVRQLQRVLGKLYRAGAVRKARGGSDEPLNVDVEELPTYLGRRKFHLQAHEGHSRAGIATGLAWTPVGGDVLTIEASTMPGTGQLVLTGQLGDVMKESARAALTYVLAHGPQLGIEGGLENRDVHIHVPAGAVPKDGPSAGVTMFTALASLLSGRSVRNDVAMTGEATLRGRVLPVGGIKAKVLAAHRRGLKRIILPKANEPDLEDLPQQTRDELEFILVDQMAQVLEAALEPGPAPSALLDPGPPTPEVYSAA